MRVHKWVQLEESLTVTEIAERLGCAADEYRTYLVSFKEWQATTPPKCGCTALCTCAKFRRTITSKSCRMTSGSHIPDPFLDPTSGMYSTRPRMYASPFKTTDRTLETQPQPDKAKDTHPLACLFQGSTCTNFARYLGAPIGTDSSAVARFVERRLAHAQSIHPFLHQLNARTAYSLLRYVALPRTFFLPSVMHPDLLPHYTTPFDDVTDDHWSRITGIHKNHPRYETLRMRRTLPTNKGGSGIPVSDELAPHALLASVKAICPHLKRYSPAAYDHLIQTLDTSDPLGVALAFRRVKGLHDWIAAQHTKESNASCPSLHKPPTAIPATPQALLAAKQTYSDHVFARNLAARTQIKLQQAYLQHDTIHCDDHTQMISQASPGAAAWLSTPPAQACILNAASPQPPQLWQLAYALWAGARETAAPHGAAKMRPLPHSARETHCSLPPHER